MHVCECISVCWNENQTAMRVWKYLTNQHHQHCSSTMKMRIQKAEMLCVKQIFFVFCGPALKNHWMLNSYPHHLWDCEKVQLPGQDARRVNRYTEPLIIQRHRFRRTERRSSAPKAIHSSRCSTPGPVRHTAASLWTSCSSTMIMDESSHSLGPLWLWQVLLYPNKSWPTGHLNSCSRTWTCSCLSS